MLLLPRTALARCDIFVPKGLDQIFYCGLSSVELWSSAFFNYFNYRSALFIIKKLV